MEDFAGGIGILSLLGAPGLPPFFFDSWLFIDSIFQIGIACISTVVVVGLQYLSERNAFPEQVYEVLAHLRAHPSQFVLLTVALILFVTGPLYVDRIMYPVVLGLPFGLLANRFLYGIIWPIPEPALNRP